MVQRAYEVFEHTADIGLHAFGSTLPELFIHAAQGMESLMVAPEQIRPLTSREIAVEGHDEVSLLIAWLNELIFLFDTEYHNASPLASCRELWCTKAIIKTLLLVRRRVYAHTQSASACNISSGSEAW